METGIIIIIIAVIVLVIAIATIASNSSRKSENLGSGIQEVSSFNGKLHILSSKPIPFDNIKETYFSLYEGGISIIQGLTTVEVPWGAIHEVKVENYSQIISTDKSVIGRAAVGGLLFGEIGAIIGGMSGLGQASQHLGRYLFLISFNYAEYGKTILGVRTDCDIRNFIEKCTLLKNQYSENMKNDIEKEELYEIGYYNCSQLIQNEETNIICSVKYSPSKEITIVCIDGRNALFRMLLNEQQRNILSQLTKKAIDWQGKAIDANLEANKSVGDIPCDLLLDYNGTTHTVNNATISLEFNCWFKDYDKELESLNIDDFYYFLIKSPNINITGEDVQIPAALIFIKIDGLKKLLNLISKENINSTIEKVMNNKNLVDSILN